MKNHLVQKVFRFLRSEDGPAAVEYALLIGFIVLAALTGIVVLGQSSSGTFEDTAKQMPGR